MRRTWISLLIVLVSVPALAQTDGTYLLVSSTTVSPTTPTTTIEVWATWVGPPNLVYFAGGNYDLNAADGQFSNPVNVLNGPGSSTGVIAGNVVSGAVQYQLHGIVGFIASPDNPILLATYDWTTLNFAPRSVSLDTSNTTFFIVAWYSSGLPVFLFPDQFAPGSGSISVVPAPAAWVVLALPLAAATRRRRS